MTLSEYEAVLKQIRPFGPFQIRTFILVSLFETPLAWAMLVPVFTAASPGFKCFLHNDDAYSGNKSGLSVSDTCSKNGTECSRGNIEFNSDFTSIVSEWSLVCDKKYIGDLITSVQMAGVLIGALIAGQVADYFGRKRVLFGGYSMLVVFWFCTAFSPNWQVYAGLRFIVGALIGGCLVVNFVLPLEFVTPAWRTFCGCVGFWAVGIMTLAPWAYFFRNWKMLNIVMSASSVPIIGLWWVIDESPRWLLSRGYLKEAELIIIKMAKFNERPLPDLEPLQEYVQREQIKRQQKEKYSYWHLCSSVRLTKSTLICMYGWFVASAAYYGLNFNSKNLAGNRYLNVFISGFVEIPALIFVLIVNNHLGRRPTTFILFLIAGLSCFSVLVIDLTGKSGELSALTIPMAMLGKSCIAGGWAAIQIFSAETFPTVIRNIGIASCSMAARIGGIVAPQLVLLGQTSKPIPFTVFGILSILCCLLILWLKETVGASLPDRLHTSQAHNVPDLQCQDLSDKNDKNSTVISLVPHEIGLNHDAKKKSMGNGHVTESLMTNDYC